MQPCRVFVLQDQFQLLKSAKQRWKGRVLPRKECGSRITFPQQAKHAVQGITYVALSFTINQIQVGLPEHIARLYFFVHLVGQLVRLGGLTRSQHPDFINIIVLNCVLSIINFFSKITISACKEVVEAKSQSVSLERAKSLNHI